MHGERITKSKTDKVIDGVCGVLPSISGLISYCQACLVVLVFFSGLGLLLYIILVIIMPKADQARCRQKKRSRRMYRK